MAFRISVATGRIAEMGDFLAKIEFPRNDAEYFRVSVAYWSVDRYIRSWEQQIAKVIAGAPVGVLLKNVHVEATANFYAGWSIYNPGDGNVYFRDCLYFVKDRSEDWSLNDPSSLAGDREAGEGGERISEWVVSVSDLRLGDAVHVSSDFDQLILL